ncbi:MAG: 6-carboxytetrahydropterin synthase [Lachnospiraceae bacterium]|nr:6-carboxytetrahydropterin synthase [Lachnospiraceae bacterium]
MNNTLYREYKFKFYLNANHFIIIDGKEGQRHPHTWEFMVDILMNNDEFVQFDAFEKAIDEYFNKYQNRVINEIAPFDHVIPTLENMSDYFIHDVRGIVKDLGGELIKMESSETPTRSYVISFEREAGFLESVRKNSEKKVDGIIDSVLDNILN